MHIPQSKPVVNGFFAICTPSAVKRIHACPGRNAYFASPFIFFLDAEYKGKKAVGNRGKEGFPPSFCGLDKTGAQILGKVGAATNNTALRFSIA
jgi:hypothetical protein